jgi:diguanylate cyclase (GGDEF)-like protein
LNLIAGSSQLAQLVREHDWSSNPLGSIDGWSETLLASVNLVLCSPFPATLSWGSEKILIYNDAAIPNIDKSHPGALGQPYRNVFQEEWRMVAEDMESCLFEGIAPIRENIYIPLLREGVLQDSFWDYSLVPIYEEDRIAGVYTHYRNTTEAVMNARARNAITFQLQQAFEDLGRTNEQLALDATVDALTGLANRRSFEYRFQEIWRTACDERSSLSVILIDLDHFKQVNDRYGHLFGDQVLRRVAHLLSETLRKGEDFAARFGGEEFVIVLPSTSPEGALQVAERVRNIVQTAGLPPLGRRLPPPERSMTVSCGAATWSPRPDLAGKDLLEAADQALYQARLAGAIRSVPFAKYQTL